jgi:hypothetical protein
MYLVLLLDESFRISISSQGFCKLRGTTALNSRTMSKVDYHIGAGQ